MMLFGTACYLALIAIAMNLMVALTLCAGVDNTRPFDWQTRPPSPDHGIDWGEIDRHLSTHSTPTISENGSSRPSPASSRSGAGRSSPISSDSSAAHSSSATSKASRSTATSSVRDGHDITSPQPQSFRKALQSTNPTLYEDYRRTTYVQRRPEGKQAEQYKKDLRPMAQIRKSIRDQHKEVHQIWRTKETARKQRQREQPGGIKWLIKEEGKGTISMEGQAKLDNHRNKAAQRSKAYRQRKKGVQQQEGQSG